MKYETKLNSFTAVIVTWFYVLVILFTPYFIKE